MPAYNAERYIGKAIESILGQTYTDLELLIIDDASTDRTLEIIKSYSDNRIRVFENPENKGISFSTNIGLRESRGEYIALMDDDDMAVRERLDIQVKYLDAHHEIDILGGRSAVIDENDNLIDVDNPPRNNPNYIKAILLFSSLDFRNGTTMMRNAFVKKQNISYRENCFGMQDYKFFIECSKMGKISAVNQILLLYRIHEFNETQRQLNDNGEKRAEKYLDFQCDSLRTSGYRIDEKEKQLIRKFFREDGGICDNYKDFRMVVQFFMKLLHQAEDMEVDYYEELEHLCKSLVSVQTIKMKNFSIEMFLGK